MEKKKRVKDENVIAYEVLKAITDKEQPTKEKNPAAVALGRLGGLKGGPARKKALSKKKRQEIAKKAAKARWEK